MVYIFRSFFVLQEYCSNVVTSTTETNFLLLKYQNKVIYIITGALLRYGKINMGVCPRLEFDDIMVVNCMAYDFYIYVAFDLFYRNPLSIYNAIYDINTTPEGTLL